MFRSDADAGARLGVIPAGSFVAGTSDNPEVIGLETLWSEIQDPNAAIQDVATPWGERLWRVLHRAGAAKRVDELLMGATKLRVVWDVRDALLERVPWEMVRSPAGPIWFATRHRPMARVLIGNGAAQTSVSPIPWPLRVLVVVAAKLPVDRDVPNGVIQTAEDVLLLRAALHAQSRKPTWLPLRADVAVRVVSFTTMEALVEELDASQPDVLHVISHGRYDVAGETALRLFSARSEQAQTWSASALAQQWGGLVMPRLLVLNCCNSADGRAAPTNRVAHTLLSIGVRAVVGLQTELFDVNALKFTERFYRAIADEESIDHAVCLARQSLGGTGFRGREWASPRLDALSVADLAPLVQPKLTVPKRQEVAACSRLAALRGFVGRHDDTLGLWELLAKDVQEQVPVLVLEGQPRVGKTRLMQATAERCAMADDLVRYVDFPVRDHSLIGALEAAARIVCVPGINDPLGRPLLAADHPARIEAAQLLWSVVGEDPRVDRLPEALPKGGPLDEAQCRTVLEAVQRMLLAAAEASAARKVRCVLFLDHVARLAPGEHSTLLGPLLEWCASGVAPNLRIIAAASTGETILGATGVLGSIPRLTLENLDLGIAEELFRDAGRQVHLKYPETMPPPTYMEVVATMAAAAQSGHGTLPVVLFNTWRFLQSVFPKDVAPVPP